MKVPFLDLEAQYAKIGDKIEKAAINVLRSGKYILGPQVKEFEEKFAKYNKVKHAISCASGTDALLLSLMAAGVKAGDEVITTPFTFFATVGVVARLGARCVFCDIDPDTFTIDTGKLEALVTEKTKAIIPVHLFGQPCDMDPVMEIARKYNLYVIEDACQAIGAEYKGKMVGSIGHTGCFSFYPTKNLGGYGDGGMITTNDDGLAEKLSRLRVHGSRPKYYHSMVGLNSRLDTLQAALLLVKMDYIDEWNEERRKNAKIYDELLGTSSESNKTKIPGVKKHRVAGYGKHIFHQYTIRITGEDAGENISENKKQSGQGGKTEKKKHDYEKMLEEKTLRRNRVKEELNKREIGAELYYPLSLHLQKCFEDLGYKLGDMPESERAQAEILSLPMYPELTYEQIEYVVKNLESAVSSNKTI